MDSKEKPALLHTDAASLMIWNLCHPDIELTRMSLRGGETILDSGNGGPLRRFLDVFGHANSCKPFQIVLTRTDGGGHRLKALSPGSTLNVFRNGKMMPRTARIAGVQLNNGDCIRVYYRLPDEKRMAGPFSFEYLTSGTLQCETTEALSEGSPESGVEERQKKPPLNLLQLPEEVLRMILARVPSSDLLDNVSAVCPTLNLFVQNGIPMEHFIIENFTQEEEDVFGRMIDSAPPLVTSIKDVVLDEDGDPGPGSLLFIQRLTEKAISLELGIADEDAAYRQIPLLQLKKVLPAACMKQLKDLSIKGWFKFIRQDGCCFEVLEQLWLLSSKAEYQAQAFMGPHAEETFPKLTSIGLLSELSREGSLQIPLEWKLHVRAIPLERVQLRCRQSNMEDCALITRPVKTLWMECSHICIDRYCSDLMNVSHLENVAIFIPDFMPETGQSHHYDAASQSVASVLRKLHPSPMKVFQLRFQVLRLEHLRMIFKGFPNLEFVHVSFNRLAGKANDSVIKELSANHPCLQGVCFQQESKEWVLMKTEWVERRLQRTQDFWKKKLNSVFGRVDDLAYGRFFYPT